MTNTDQIDENIDDAELLLPWYVSGKLSEADRQKVEAWLSENPQAQDHLARASEEMDLTFADSEQLGRPSRESFDRLMAEIGPGRQQAAAASGGWIEKIWEALSPRYALAGAAALCLVVLAQAAAITMMNTGAQPASEFAVASSENAARPELTALVRFGPGVPLGEITAVLDELDLRIADGPKPGGIFLIAASDDEAGAAALEALSARGAIVTFFSAQD